ncbi:hypothetical protein BKA70DRAFT_1239745 [Coprinopsis sp. MPI-PUGE-AT-0042]|nr:hypothetical protein BKA70DRAFT_1239745 [Coprinopsis sp. MPI-PUGE-AT-0042]
MSHLRNISTAGGRRKETRAEKASKLSSSDGRRSYRLVVTTLNKAEVVNEVSSEAGIRKAFSFVTSHLVYLYLSLGSYRHRLLSPICPEILLGSHYWVNGEQPAEHPDALLSPRRDRSCVQVQGTHPLASEVKPLQQRGIRPGMEAYVRSDVKPATGRRKVNQQAVHTILQGVSQYTGLKSR